MGLACFVPSNINLVHGKNSFPPRVQFSGQNYLDEKRRMQGFKASFLERGSSISSPSPSPAPAPTPTPETATLVSFFVFLLIKISFLALIL